MSKGTDAGLLAQPKPQSVYKHAILEQYVGRFATMTSTYLTPRRSVLFDGFAGRGRFDGGKAASAEHMMLHAQKMKSSVQIDVFLVEQNRKDWELLDEVASEYRGRGVTVTTRHGGCEDYLSEVYEHAKGASLFMFLDPCGAVLPFDTLKPLLTRRGERPRTEFLMNFSADLIRRAGGQVKAGLLDAHGVAQADRVCGGTWWRDLALTVHEEWGGTSWEKAAEAVAMSYAARLTMGTHFTYAIAPVRRQVHHQPVYFLIFLTADPHGFWMFGDAASKAREDWLQFIGPDDAELEGMLINLVEDQLDREHEKAIEAIKENLRAVCEEPGAHHVVREWALVFGDVYGEAKVSAFTKALSHLVKAGEIEYVDKGSKPHKHVIKAGPALKAPSGA